MALIPMDQDRFTALLKIQVLNLTTGNFLRILNKNDKINTSFVSPGLKSLGANKTGFNLIIFHFNIRGKL